MPDLRLVERLAPGTVPATAVDAAVTLRFDERRRSRLPIHLDDGRAAALLLPRGTRLRGGDLLRAESGVLVVVRAAVEPVSVSPSNPAVSWSVNSTCQSSCLITV
jgi:urease accessory protein